MNHAVWKSASRLDRDALVEVLQYRGPAQEQLFKAAEAATREAFGDRVLVRGVIEVTNLCRVNCDYCPMRRDNTRENDTFILTVDDILAAATSIRDTGINIVFLQGGEVPQTTKLVLEAIPSILCLFDGDVEILLNLGNKSPEEYRQLREAGATSYILKHETSDPDLNLRMRHESLEDRLQCMGTLLDLGYKVGTGTIVGLPGQTLESIADDIVLAAEMGVHMSSAAPFVPAPATPLENHPPGSIEITLNAIAAMRLADPSWLVPSVSALEKTSGGGQARGLRAGANVLTVNFTPAARQETYLIYGKNRYVVKLDHVKQMLGEMNLRMSRSIFTSTRL